MYTDHTSYLGTLHHRHVNRVPSLGLNYGASSTPAPKKDPVVADLETRLAELRVAVEDLEGEKGQLEKMVTDTRREQIDIIDNMQAVFKKDEECWTLILNSISDKDKNQAPYADLVDKINLLLPLLQRRRTDPGILSSPTSVAKYLEDRCEICALAAKVEMHTIRQKFFDTCRQT